MNDFWNLDPDDKFDPNNSEIENDEIAKLHAIKDMEKDHIEWAHNQANKFYSDFKNLNVTTSIYKIKKLIEDGEIKKSDVILMLSNVIKIFETAEEYEKCHICSQIKKGIENVRI